MSVPLWEFQVGGDELQPCCIDAFGSGAGSRNEDDKLPTAHAGMIGLIFKKDLLPNVHPDLLDAFDPELGN